MSSIIQNSIQELADELKVFNRNDVLVDLSDHEEISPLPEQSSIILPIEGALKKTIKKARLHFRESGSSIFCVSQGLLNWEWKGNTCSTPILLFPCMYKEDRIKKQFELSWDTTEGFINPFLQFYFEKEFDFNWSDIDFTNWNELEVNLKSKGFSMTVKDNWHYGNFHHHRFSVLRELETLTGLSQLSRPLQSIYNEKTEIEDCVLDLSKSNLFPADNDQLRVFEEVENKNLVVHGPPGTGKSQVLSNILGKNLIGNHRTLVVSEKRVALEVLEQKLQSMELHLFVFLQNDKSGSQHLLNQLKSTWQVLENYEAPQLEDVKISKFKLDGLQLKLNVLLDEKRVGGISYMQFLELSKSKNLDPVSFSSNSPTISSFLEHKKAIKELYDSKLNTLCQIIPKSIVDGNDIFQLEDKIQVLEKHWLSLQTTCAFDTKDGLHQALNKAIFAQILVNEEHKDYYKIIRPDSSDGKKFKRLTKKYFVLKKEISNLEENDSIWRTRPSLMETKELLNSISKSNFFEKRKLKKRLSTLLTSSFVDQTEALNGNLTHQEKKQEFREIEKKLTEIGVHTETEIHWLKDLLPKMTADNWQNWEQNDASQNKDLAEANEGLNLFYQNIRTYLNLEENQPISTSFNLFTAHFTQFLENRKFLSSLETNLYKAIGKNSSLEELEDSILKSNWVQFVEQFPAFNDFQLNQIFSDLDEIIQLEEKEAILFSHEITNLKKKQFDDLNALLQIPARKLSEQDKERKVRLRKGRSLLIKEFGKTRSHPTIRELLDSDASEWIYTLLPIWMANPSQVGDFFPLESELFDTVLFDEATQIPLSNSLGSLHRGKRAVVLGDEHQMSPSNYFKAGETEPIDLLHQATFNWPQVMLKHHYRSEYPELIAFSNRHFYGNELIAYPNANIGDDPIQIHHIKEGVYTEQENIEEAKALVKCLSKQLSNSTSSIGVVAFSEKQLHCIYNQFSSADRQLLDEKIENNTAFFRSLENVQGDECDHLFISLGYGKNEEGKLSFNFGPLNRKTGPRRLNVLLSRAKQKIEFFTSIEAKELTLSDNDALNLLRQFLQTNVSQSAEKQLSFPMGLELLKIDKQETKTSVQFKNLIESVSNANELLTLYRVLKMRGWDITF